MRGAGGDGLLDGRGWRLLGSRGWRLLDNRRFRRGILGFGLLRNGWFLRACLAASGNLCLRHGDGGELHQAHLHEEILVVGLAKTELVVGGGGKP